MSSFIDDWLIATTAIIIELSHIYLEQCVIVIHLLAKEFFFKQVFRVYGLFEST